MAFDPDINLRAVVGIPGTSGIRAVVLLGADGPLAGGPVVTREGIEGLVDHVLAELAAAGADW